MNAPANPRRSLLYMPGANPRAMAKARGIDCDVVIFDLEDAVAPNEKVSARGLIQEALDEGGYGHRELVVRVNSLSTPWGKDDVAAFAKYPLSALLFPKVESVDEVAEILAVLDAADGPTLPIWIMVETPKGVLDLRHVADHKRIQALVMGTSDLVKELRASHTQDRHNLDYALQQCVLVARLLQKEIFDGVHLDFKNLTSLQKVCEGGRAMGFDGKTLIHPGQVEMANEIFGYSDEDIAQAHQILQVWEQALKEGKGVAVLDGKLIENLHAQEAQRIVAFAESLAARE